MALDFPTDEREVHRWKARRKKRRKKKFHAGHVQELNLVAMMDMLTVLVIFLLKSYSVSALAIPVGGEIVPPISSNIERPQEAVKLTVTHTGGAVAAVIAVDEKPIIQLDSKTYSQLEAMARDRKFLIPDLKDSLDMKARAIKEIANVNPTVKFEGKVLVIADKNIPYWLITQVLYTAAEASFDQYSLVAVREKQE